MTEKEKVVGYLPDERPTIGKTLVFAIQQFLVMLPATVLAAVIMNGFQNADKTVVELYSIPAALLASGVATIAFLLITKGKIPLYYGSSFSYIPAVGIVVGTVTNETADSAFGAILIASVISGLMSVIAGILINKFGANKIEKILPSHITGMIAMIIGLSLAGSTMNNVLYPDGSMALSVPGIIVSVITFLAIAVLTVVFKKGFISQIPILIGLGIGVLTSYLIYVPNLYDDSYFANIGQYFTEIPAGKIGIFAQMPWNSLPAAFANPSLIGIAIIAIFPIAFATIPESAAHVNQIDLYINELKNKKNVTDKEYNVKELLGKNLIGDGIGDIIAVMMGGPAGTNYGENVSASAVTKNFSSFVFGVTGVLAILVSIILGFTGNINISTLLTTPVVQGVSIYLFGAIAVQGIALMIEKRIDIFNPKVIAVMAFIGIVGLGVSEIKISDTFILPSIGVAAIGGILLNVLLEGITYLLTKKKNIVKK